MINFRANTHKVLFPSLSVTAMSFTTSGKNILIALRDGSINLIDLQGNIKKSQKTSYHTGHILEIITSQVHANDGLFYTLSSDKLVVWSEVSMEKLTSMNVPNDEVKFCDVNVSTAD